VTPEQCSLCTGWHRTYHHTIFSAKLVRQKTHGCHYPLQSWELHSHSQHSSHKTLWPDYKQFLHSPPTFLTAAHYRRKENLLHICHPFRARNKHWKHKTASYAQRLDDTHGPPVFQLVTHPTIFWNSGITVFLLWLSWALWICSISKRTQAFYAIQTPCHKKRRRSTYPKHTVCPPAKHRKIQAKFFHWPYWVCK